MSRYIFKCKAIFGYERTQIDRENERKQARKKERQTERQKEEKPNRQTERSKRKQMSFVTKQPRVPIVVLSIIGVDKYNEHVL